MKKRGEEDWEGGGRKRSKCLRKMLDEESVSNLRVWKKGCGSKDWFFAFGGKRKICPCRPTILLWAIASRKLGEKIPPSQPLFNFRQVHLLKSVRKEKPRGGDFFLFLQKIIGLNLTTRSLIHQLRKPHTHFALREVPFQSLLIYFEGLFYFSTLCLITYFINSFLVEIICRKIYLCLEEN